MKNTLDNLTKIKKLDQSNLRGSIAELYLQINHAWSDVDKIKLDKKYKEIDNIAVCGMGGSSIGAHIIKSLYSNDKIKKTFEIINDYALPQFLNKNSLVILSSYSGNTEETLFNANLALQKKAKIIGITAGGKLAKFCQENKIPYYQINPKYNPSNQPRMALGYSIVGQLALLAKCGIIKITKKEINSLINYLKELDQKWNLKIPANKNLAKKTAAQLHNKIPIIIASEFLLGNAHTLTNQINENSKTFASYFAIPELNHHLLESLSLPPTNKQIFKFFFINSRLYHPRNQKRHEITQEIIKKNKLQFIEYKPIGKTKLEQSFEILLFGSYISLYLAMINNLDPSPIPWVDYFKKRLS